VKQEPRCRREDPGVTASGPSTPVHPRGPPDRRLIHRTTRRLRITEEGADSRCRRILDEVDDAGMTAWRRLRRDAPRGIHPDMVTPALMVALRELYEATPGPGGAAGIEPHVDPIAGGALRFVRRPRQARCLLPGRLFRRSQPPPTTSRAGDIRAAQSCRHECLLPPRSPETHWSEPQQGPPAVAVVDG
jgi:hypothetical protein